MNSNAVLDIFKTITKIPRESGYEGPMTEFLVNWAAEHNLECKMDDVHNVCITKPASPGKENVPTIVLQSHQDMVCEKIKGSSHDFFKDPVEYIIQDGWMIAPETTLGADDGIGIAASLAILESDLPTGRIECVFTISEETGMDGAFGMQKGFFTGNTLINLDSEDEGQLFIGCAGGLNTEIAVRCKTSPVKTGLKTICLKISGGLGGHSGDEINKDRMNAIQQMARFLFGFLDRGIQLISIDGGNKPNAIPRECEAVVACADTESIAKEFLNFGKILAKEEFYISDPGISFESCEVKCDRMAMDDKDAVNLICALFSMHHGVAAMSQTIPGLVETSSNLASVKTESNGNVLVVTSQRSAIRSARRAMADRIDAAFRHLDCDISKKLEYPGWNPDTNSPILKACIESYRRLFSEDPEVKAIHAGLECGLFGEKFGDMDMISFGPTLRGVHAPGERLELASLDRFTELLCDVLCNFK